MDHETIDKAWELIKWFVMDALGGSFEHLNLEHLKDFDPDPVAMRKNGYDLLMQIIYRSHMKLIEACEVQHCEQESPVKTPHPFRFFAKIPAVTPDVKILAPETQAVKVEKEEVSGACFVPETQARTVIPDTCAVDDSPSIFSNSRRERKLSNDDDDDFKKSKTSPSGSNRFGITPSQESKQMSKKTTELKQGRMDTFLGKKSSKVPLKTKEEEDLERAIELSKKEMIRVPLGCLDESFNRLDDDEDGAFDPGDCKECKKIAKNPHLRAKHKKDICQRCAIKPVNSDSLKESPKVMWELEVGDPEKTQVGSPLKRRRKRRLKD